MFERACAGSMSPSSAQPCTTLPPFWTTVPSGSASRGRRVAGLLVELAARHRLQRFVRFDQALGDRPGALVAPGEVRPAGVRQQHLETGGAAPEQEDLPPRPEASPEHAPSAPDLPAAAAGGTSGARAPDGSGEGLASTFPGGPFACISRLPAHGGDICPNDPWRGCRALGTVAQGGAVVTPRTPEIGASWRASGQDSLETLLPYVDDLLTEESLRKKGYFQANRVTKLIDKIRRQDGRLRSERENMAITGILSTQLLDEMFIKNFPFHPVMEPENVKVYDFSSKA